MLRPSCFLLLNRANGKLPQSPFATCPAVKGDGRPQEARFRVSEMGVLQTPKRFLPSKLHFVQLTRGEEFSCPYESSFALLNLLGHTPKFRRAEPRGMSPPRLTKPKIPERPLWRNFPVLRGHTALTAGGKSGKIEENSGGDGPRFERSLCWNGIPDRH